jgi:hypothetical protein
MNVVLSDKTQRPASTVRRNHFVLAHVVKFARSCKVELSSHVSIIETC